MDENKELGNQQPQSGDQTDPYIAAPQENNAPAPPDETAPGEASGGPALSAPPQLNGEGGPAPQVTAKKVNAGFVALAVLAGVLVIAIIAVIVIGIFGKKPEEAVREAFTLTGEKMQALSDQLMEDIPIYEMFLPKDEGYASHFKLAADSLEAPSLGAGTQGMVSGIIKMFSVSGDLIREPSAGLAELNAGVNISDVPIIAMHLQATPDQVSFNVPALSDTVLSVNPNTLAEDYKRSPVYSPDMDDETLKNMQDALSMQLMSLTASGGIDLKKMQDDMYQILDGAFVNATYDKPVKKDGAKVYAVHLDGSQLSRTIAALLRYIYIDSDLGKRYPENMREIFERNLIAPFEEKSEAGTGLTMNVTVGSSGLISLVEIIEETDGSPENGEDAFGVTYRLNEDLTLISMDFNMAQIGDAFPGKIKMNMTADYTDGNCKANMTGVFDMVMEGTPVKYDMTLDTNLDKEGNVDMGMGINMNESPDATIPAMKMDFTLKGTYTVDENNVAAWDFPTLKFGMDAAELGGYNAMNFTFSGETKPLEEPVRPDTNTTPLFSMTEDQLAMEAMKYQEGLSSLMEAVFGFSMPSGGMGYEEVPPDAMDATDFMDPAA